MGKVDVHDTGRGERVDTSAGFPADLAGSGGRFVSSDDPGVQAVAGASGKDWGTVHTPRLERLYQDAYGTFNERRYVDIPLLEMLMVLGSQLVEVDESDDAQIRLAYGVRS